MTTQVATSASPRPRASFALAWVALGVGVAAYLVRPSEIAAFGVPGISSPIDSLRRLLAPLRDVIPPPVLGVLPDVAWATSLALVLTRLRSGKIFLVLGFVLCAGWEIGQALRIIPGTFDLFDLVASSAAYAAVVLLDRFLQRKGFAS
jgi:hypothetical protein